MSLLARLIKMDDSITAGIIVIGTIIDIIEYIVGLQRLIAFFSTPNNPILVEIERIIQFYVYALYT